MRLTRRGYLLTKVLTPEKKTEVSRLVPADKWIPCSGRNPSRPVFTISFARHLV